MSMTVREQQKECNTLVSSLSGTIGHNVIVELRNDTTVAGICCVIWLSKDGQMFIFSVKQSICVQWLSCGMRHLKADPSRRAGSNLGSLNPSHSMPVTTCKTCFPVKFLRILKFQLNIPTQSEQICSF